MRVLMERDPVGRKGQLIRYEGRGSTLRDYWIANGPAVDFLEDRHAEAKNIGRNKEEGSYSVITIFDDEVFRVVSEFAGDPHDWHLNGV